MCPWRVPETTDGGVNHADHDQYRHVDDKEVGGDGEEASCFPDAAQVAECDQYDESDRQRYRSACQYGRRGDDGV